MRLLLDTQAFLWFVLNHARLSSTARTLIVDPANELLFSPASYSEIAIKVSIGKYQVPGPFKDFMDRQIAINRLTILPITVAHAAVIAALPFHHRDPFVRLLVAQSLVENVPLVSSDSVVDAYGVVRRW